jgi:hypothetical protein
LEAKVDKEKRVCGVPRDFLQGKQRSSESVAEGSGSDSSPPLESSQVRERKEFEERRISSNSLFHSCFFFSASQLGFYCRRRLFPNRSRRLKQTCKEGLLVLLELAGLETLECSG